uniref:Thioredoxin domain-containing protein n=1 Tax=Ananas comosus var. bracteatus TaxID=296719 RepID=A0A6V7QF92_ANACO|nr:unnamed protein product [Ananas comosus var. bracteatus]
MAAPGDDEVLVQFNIMGGDASIGARASDGSAREESNIFDVPSTDAWKDIWKSLKSNTTVLECVNLKACNLCYKFTSGFISIHMIGYVCMLPGCARFTAQWCGPCRFIEPAVKELAGKFASVKFYKIDVDKMEVSIAFFAKLVSRVRVRVRARARARTWRRKWKVRAMPTFILVKGGQEVSRVVGAKKNELDRKITQALQATKN